MTNEELFTDLKQFIEATVSQHTGHLEQRMDEIESTMATKGNIDRIGEKVDSVRSELKADIGLLDEKLDTIQDAIAESVTHTGSTLQSHEQRLRRLEHKTA